MPYEVAMFVQLGTVFLLLVMFYRIYRAIRRFILSSRMDTTSRLQRLDALLRDGTINTEEHARQRAAIIARV